jgi:hypothetical protein
VWSLGASIYELAEGMLPFSGMGGVVLQQGAEIPRLSPGWSQQLNDVMRSCLEKETWSRAKASDVEKIAATVLKGETIDIPNGKATRRIVPTDDFDKEDPKDDNDDFPESYPDSTPWWKKPVTWGISTVAIVLAAIAIWYLPQSDEAISQPLKSETVNTVDTLGTSHELEKTVAEEQSETPMSPKDRPGRESPRMRESSRIDVVPEPIAEKQSTSGTVNL